MVCKDLKQLNIKKVYGSQDIKKGTKMLKDGKDIMIRLADKGGDVVLSKEQYGREMSRFLEDSNTY